MDYIQRPWLELMPEPIGCSLIFAAPKHNTVRQILEEDGCRTITFATGFAWAKLTDVKERAFDILNAYCLPGRQDALYPSASPVNSFRIVFNAYFGARYPLLPDYICASPVPKIYDFTFISNPCKAGK